jgi:photosystem II stability/assembly factor-like uncharacterized protein
MKKIFSVLITVLILCPLLYSQSEWIQMPSGTNEKLNSIFCNYVTTYDIWIVGNNGTVLKSTDEGTNWTKITLPFTNHFNSIYFNYLTGFITGNNGLVLMSTNSGLNWNQLNTGVTTNLKSLYSYTNNILVSVGDNGLILRTSNFGSSWSTIQSNTTSNLNKITQNIIAGDNGVILRTPSSGLNWSTIASGTNNNLNDVTRYSPSLIYISGNTGTILVTTNSGFNWSILPSNITNNLNSVCIRNTSSNVHSVGQNGQYIKSTNSGINWTGYLIGPNTNLNQILFWNLNLGWVVGDNGVILKNYLEYENDSYKRLDANTISAWYRNNGSFNRNPYNGNAGFEWPKDSRMTARYASGLWIGAIVGGDTLLALAEYDYEYLPGYTDGNGIPQGKNDSNYRVYKLQHNMSSQDRQYWPNSILGNSNQGAPVFFDQISNSWKPIDFADQTMFYRITDSYPEAHTNRAGSTAPLKADVMQINFSFDEPGAVGNTIYMHYNIINKSSQTWNNFYFTIWTDDDVGYAADDKIGCDSSSGLCYTYNGNDNDPVYGTAPPAVGFVEIRGPKYFTGNNNDTANYCFAKFKRNYPKYKNSSLSVFSTYTSGAPVYGDPRIYYETYRILQGLGRDGTPWINPITNQLTKFVYSGDPVTNTGWVQQVSDEQRFLLSFGPVNIPPNDTQMIVIAQVIAKGTSNLNSITLLRQYAQIAKDNYNNCFANVPIGIKNNNEVVNEFRLYQNYPNPFNPISNIKYKIAKLGFVTLKIYDVLGKEVITLVNEQQKPGVYDIDFDGTNYSSGLYFYELTIGDFRETRKMVLIK